ncbi:glucose/arabinose dehydrogenase [Sphingomonas zeicaulis]|uniref:PQQ-dependent sugar dehydrogenase n=1 Tax=Sphingomonas zeicaulis TaxID=1632740 RepID=UPI003D249CA0
MLKRVLILVAVLAVFLFAGWFFFLRGQSATLSVEAVTGAKPTITRPSNESIPTVNIADPVGWKEGQMPTPAGGLKVQPFATGLDHPRWMTLLPNGDVLVAESNKPKSEAGGSVTQRIMGWLMGRAGAGVPSANRISLLRDANGDGIAEQKFALLEGLNSPFGMALVGDTLYVGNTDALMAFPFKVGETKISAKGRKIIDLPATQPNNHWTRNVLANADGTRLYVTVGSNSNIGENGMETEVNRAAILEVDPKTGRRRVFASGLRNPNGLAWEPVSGTLWTTVNERDMLGGDLAPDYLTQVNEGDFFGWPWAYWSGYPDKRVQPERPDMLEYTRRPDYALGPHTASLGLAFADRAQLGGRFVRGAFIGQHGSWNRKPASGYKVVFVPFGPDGFPAKNAKPIDVLTGFLVEGDARGRPVGTIIDGKGALLVADDVGNTVWRVSAAR